MNFTGSDWALIITALTGFLGMLGTQIISLRVSLKNSRHLSEANTKIDEAKVAAVEAKGVATETKAVIDDVKTQTDGLIARAVDSAHAQGTAEGTLAGRKEVVAEIQEANGGGLTTPDPKKPPT